MWFNQHMTLEDLADLIRANSANLNRRMEDLHNQSYGQLLNLQNDVNDVKAHVADIRRDLDLSSTVAAMQRDIIVLQAEIAILKRRA